MPLTHWHIPPSHLTDSLDVSLELYSAFFFLLTGEREDLLGRKGRQLRKLGQVFLQLFVKAIELAIAQRRVKSPVDVDMVDGEGLLIPTHSHLLRVGDGEVHGDRDCDREIVRKSEMLTPSDGLEIEDGWMDEDVTRSISFSPMING